MKHLNKTVKQQFLSNIGKNVRKIRKQKNMTQTDLAMKINEDNNNICRIEKGLINFGIINLLISAEALDTDLADLLDIENIRYLKKHILEDTDYKELRVLN